MVVLGPSSRAPSLHTIRDPTVEFSGGIRSLPLAEESGENGAAGWFQVKIRKCRFWLTNTTRAFRSPLNMLEPQEPTGSSHVLIAHYSTDLALYVLLTYDANAIY